MFQIPFTSIVLFADPEPADFLTPEVDIEGYRAEIGDMVSDGNRLGIVYTPAAPSPYPGDADWYCYIVNLPGTPAWGDYWLVYDIEIIQTANETV